MTNIKAEWKEKYTYIGHQGSGDTLTIYWSFLTMYMLSTLLISSADMLVHLNWEDYLVTT